MLSHLGACGVIMGVREECSACGYPLVVCICSHITPVQFATRLVILQHPSESGKAKNTARLLALVAPATEVIVGEKEEDFDNLKTTLENSSEVAVLFPSADSTGLVYQSGLTPVRTLILIDGTWRKAKKIWQLNPWLKSFKVCKLATGTQSRYRIRKSTQTDGLSTIEAAASALELIERADCEPLYEVLDAMQSHWQRFSDH